MKRGTKITGVIAIILLVTISFAFAADPEENTIAKILKALVSDVNILDQRVQTIETKLGVFSIEDSPSAPAQVKHVLLEDEACTTNPVIEVVGWCPDGHRTVFNIPDIDYKINSVVEPQVAKKLINPPIIKRMHCVVNNVIFDQLEKAYMRVSCPTAPAEGSRLIYTLANRP